MSLKKPEHPQHNLIEEQAIAWFSRLQAESVSAEEKVQFLHWKSQSPAHQQAYDDIALLWDDPDLNLALTEATLSDSITKPTPTSAKGYHLSLAMVASLAMFIFIFDPVTRLQADFQTAIGDQQIIHLSDGSSVTLNTNSALAVDFSHQERRVRLLKGEAYFAVDSDKNKPFIIDSGKTETRVLVQNLW